MLKSSFIFNLLTATAMFTLCFTLSDSFATHILNRLGTGYLIRLSAFLILFQATLSIANSAFLGLDRMQDNALTVNIQSIVKATSSLLLIVFFGLSVVGALVGHVLGYMAAAISGFLILFLKHYRNLGGAPKGNSFSNNLRVMVGYGFPLYVSTLLGSLLGQYQTIILAIFTSNTDIGNLSVAMNLTALIGLLTFPLSVLFPAFSKVDPKGDETKRLFRLSVKYTSLLIVPAATAVAVLSRDLVLLIYGIDFSLAPLLLSTYAINFLYVGIGSMVLSHLLSGAGETKLILKALLINLSIFVPLAPALTWLDGVLGLKAGLLASSLLSLIYQLSMARKKLGVDFNPREFLKIYLASAISAVPTLLFIHLSPLNTLPNLIIGGSVFLLTYLTLTPIIGAITHTDLQNLNFIFSKIKFVWSILKLLLRYENKVLLTVSPPAQS